MQTERCELFHHHLVKEVRPAAKIMADDGLVAVMRHPGTAPPGC